MSLAPLLTVDDVAARLGVDRDAVSRWIAKKELLAVNVAQAKNAKRPTWRIRPEDLDAFEFSRSTRPTTTAARATKAERPRLPITRKWV